MEILTVKLGERAQLAAMSASDAAVHVRQLTDTFVEVVSDTIDRIRQAASTPTTRPDSSLPSVQQTTSCKGCGMYVEPGERYCAVCKEKPQYQSPKASIEVGQQPDPAYRDAPLGQVPR